MSQQKRDRFEKLLEEEQRLEREAMEKKENLQMAKQKMLQELKLKLAQKEESMAQKNWNGELQKTIESSKENKMSEGEEEEEEGNLNTGFSTKDVVDVVEETNTTSGETFITINVSSKVEYI